jgi:hypothetical protein
MMAMNGVSRYRRAMDLAAAHHLKLIAFPSISTGAFGYPIDQAATVAVSTVWRFISETDWNGRAVFCCYSEEDLTVYRAGALGQTALIVSSLLRSTSKTWRTIRAESALLLEHGLPSRYKVALTVMSGGGLAH